MQLIYSKFRLWILLTMLPSLLLSQHLEWEYNYGGSDFETAQDMQKTSDDGYILAGYTGSNDHDIVSGNYGEDDYWVVKLNANGTLEWEQHYGGSGLDRANAICQTDDGGYIVAGRSDSADHDVSGNHGEADYWVLKLDETGGIEWEQNYGGSDIDVPEDILQTYDGGYIVAGYTYSDDGDISSGNNGQNDYWILKLDAGGAVEWEHNYGGSSYDYARSVVESGDSSFIVAGSADSDDNDVSGNYGGRDIWIIKIDQEDGGLIWDKNMGSSAYDGVSTIRKIAEGGYIVAGSAGEGNYHVSEHHGSRDYWIVKLRENGTIEWEQAYGGSLRDVARDIRQTLDGGYIITGSSRSDDHDVSGNYNNFGSTPDYWVVKVDVQGVMEWQQNYGGMGSDIPYAVIQTGDGGYIMAGNSTSNNFNVSSNHGFRDVWVIRLCTHTDAVINPTVCGSYTTPSGDFTYTKSGTYTDIISNTAGCDSVMTINLTVNDTVDASVIQNGNVLQAEMFEANYQWGTCDDGFEPIAGAIDQVYSAPTSGEYAVVVQKDGCVDTSACYSVTTTNVAEKEASDISVYPNPAKDQINIEMGMNNDPSLIEIKDIYGKVIYTKKLSPLTSSTSIPLKGQAGIYFITITQQENKQTFKIIKQQ